MTYTIAVDVDSVVADLMPEWLRRYNLDYNDSMTVEDITEWSTDKLVKPECGLKIYDYLSDDDLYDCIDPIKGSLEGVNTLRKMGCKIFFATACENIGMAFQKKEWLPRHGFMPNGFNKKEFMMVTDKSLIAADFLIDDGAHNIKDFHTGYGILLDAPWNRYLQDEIEHDFVRVYNWKEIIELIEQSIFSPKDREVF